MIVPRTGKNFMQRDNSNKSDLTYFKVEYFFLKQFSKGTSLAVQWLVLYASPAGGTGSILGRGAKILRVEWHSQKKKNVKQFSKVLQPRIGIFTF